LLGVTNNYLGGKMKKVDLQVRTTTPTFMGGGDRRLDGIRVSEIKGMMRWWFRALAGSLIGDDLPKLKKLEGNIFGNTYGEKQTRKSKFRISVIDKNLRFIRENSNTSYMNGFTYLGIGNVLFKFDRQKGKFVPNPDKADGNKNVMIDTDSQFSIRLDFSPVAQDDEINLIAGSFYLATAFGGFGLRARKGFGSWQIVGFNGVSLSFNPADYKKESIERTIDELKNKIEKMEYVSSTVASKYPDLGNYTFETIPTNETDYSMLLDTFGQRYRGFRVCAENPKPGIPRRGIHTADFDYLSGVSKPKDCKELSNFNNYKIRNALFGLNIVYPQLHNSLQAVRKINDRNETLRRASPVWFSIKRINGKLTLHITLFKSEFLSNDAWVEFKGSKKEVESYDLIEKKFIPYIKKELK
jgi:CRISPR-associated protein Cmr1